MGDDRDHVMQTPVELMNGGGICILCTYLLHKNEQTIALAGTRIRIDRVYSSKVLALCAQPREQGRNIGMGFCSVVRPLSHAEGP